MKWSSALVLVVLAAVLAGAAPASARNLQIGIADDAVLRAGGDDADAAVRDWAAMGVDVARVQVPWASVAPSRTSPFPPIGFNPADPNDPAYDWGAIDGAVNRLVRAGIRPMLMIDGPPPLWGSGNPALGNPRYRPSATAFANFAFAVARRYGDRVDEYILWNEPNLPVWIQPQAKCGVHRCTPQSADVYRAMVRAAYPAIHAGDATSKVLIGALAPAGGDLKSENANMRPLEFLRALGCVDEQLKPIVTGGCANFQPALADGFSYHPHSTRHAPSQPYTNRDNADLGSLGKVEGLLDSLQARGRLQGATRPLLLWLDEYGYQTNPPDRLRGVSPGAQDRYLQQAAYIAWRDPRVAVFTQYLWTDEPVDGSTKYTGWQSGLHFVDGSDKPALDHFDDPIWIDFGRKEIWGQVRPGGVHTVRVEGRLPGGATGWQPIGGAVTDVDGGWRIPATPVPFASYRSVSDDGRTSAALVAVPPGQDFEDTGAADDEAAIDVRTVPPVAGLPIPPSFAGFSIEYWSAPAYLGRTHPNPIFARLVDTLAAPGNGAPTIRLGGNSTDETWWNPLGAPPPGGVSTAVNPAFLGVLGQWAGATHTPFVLGLNFALGDPANAAAYAQAAAATLPPGTLAGVEIGNEADLYTQGRAFTVGRRRIVRGLRRPGGYGYADFRGELQGFRAAVAGAAPGVPMSLGGFATAAWEDHEDDLLSVPGPGPVGFSAHTYALHTCDSRRRTAAALSKSLLGSSAFAPPVSRMAQLAAVAAANGAALRVSEMNSANCGGVRGASNTLASALWGADILFGLAQAGVRGVNFHMFKGAFYAPVDVGLRNGHPVARVRPLFYGMLLFDRATPRGARFLPAGPNPSSAHLKTWATIDPVGTRRIVVINKDPGRARTVSLRVPGGAKRARVERLLGPGVTAKQGITLGGQSFGFATSDGKLRGKRSNERVERRSGAFRLDVPAGSAALVTVRRGP